MYRSSSTPVMECQFTTRPDGREGVPCGKRHADLVLVKTSEMGKVKRSWAWWCEAHTEFYHKYLARVNA